MTEDEFKNRFGWL